MVEKTRKMGSDFIGDVLWGSHVCQFYRTKEDLTDILVPYFEAGLENNEFCMWITGELLDEKEIRETMRKNLPQFDHYIRIGQIEIIPYTEWYLIDGVFDQHRVLNAWMDKLDQALVKGYEGMRVTGDAAPLIKTDWAHLVDYETKVNDSIHKNRMKGVCTYPLEKCESSEVVDVIRTHQFMLNKRVGEWECLEISVGRKNRGIQGSRKAGSQPLLDTIDSSSRSYTADTDAVPTLDTEGIQPPSNSETIMVSGYGRSQTGIACQCSGCFCIELELDPCDFQIVDLAYKKIPCLGEEMLRDALLGYKIEEGIKNAIDQVEKRLPFPLKSGIITALEGANRWYEKMKEDRKKRFGKRDVYC